MSSPYVKLGNRTLDQWKVTELKEELKKRRLTTSGLKQDLVKRLDEAIRIEMESLEDEEKAATKSETSVEKANADTNVSEKANDFTDGETGLVEKVQPDSGHAVDDCRVMEADLVRAKAIGLEREQISEPSVMEATQVNETVQPSTESNSQNHGTNEDVAAAALIIDDEHPQEDVKLELSGPNETQNEEIHSTDQRENDGSDCLQPDSNGQPLKNQVSEVDPSLGFQVTSDCVSTEFVPSIEKTELKMDIIDDNVKLEMDAKLDGGESHPMDIGESLDKKVSTYHVDCKDVEEPKGLHIETTDEGKVEHVDSGDMGPPEKLSLDRSSGDDSTEEDVMESKHMDDRSDGFAENMEKSRTPVETVQQVEMKAADVENETVSGKRKLLDKEAVSNNDAAKKMRRWNSEGLKNSGSITTKASPEPISKPIPVPNIEASVETPKERVVPPAARPPTNSLRIDRFLRPFTLKAVQELLAKSGAITSFWMDHIKTHCYVSYSSVEEAVETRNAVYNLQWPPNGGRLLVAEFVDPEEVKSRSEAPPAIPSTTTTSNPPPRQQLVKQQIPPPLPPPPLSNRVNLPPPPPPPLVEKVEPPILTLDDLFRKTKATPRIYYLPLSEEAVAAKMNTQGKNVTQ